MSCCDLMTISDQTTYLFLALNYLFLGLYLVVWLCNYYCLMYTIPYLLCSWRY